MPLKNSLSETSSFGKVLLLIALMTLGTIVALLILLGLNSVFFDLPLNLNNSLSSNSEPEVILSTKLLQIASQIGLFILPAIGFAYLTAPSIKKGISLNGVPHIRTITIVLACTLLAIPFINLLAQWNSNWHLPEAFQSIENWMRNMQAANDQLMEVILIMNTPTDIGINIVMMAILPAIGEELIFRGILQKLFIKLFKQPHIAILVTSIIFSAFHLQFLGFFSRLILGMLFGYLFYYSKNIWTAILAHFTNNFLALVLALIYGTEMSSQTFESENDPILIISSVIAMAFSIFLLTKNRSTNFA